MKMKLNYKQLTTNPEGMTDEGTYIVISTKPVLKVRWLGLNIEPNVLLNCVSMQL